MFKGFSDLLSFEQRLQVGSHQVEVKEQLAEGGYAYIYRAVDAGSNAEWALKKIICQSQERLLLAQAEVAVLRRLPVHPNLVRYVDSSQGSESGTAVVYILMELCKEGTLINLLERYNGQLTLPQLLFIFKEVCTGVAVLHDLGIIHRDIKLENVLLSNKHFKLVDFGSCTSEVLNLSQASREQLLKYEEEFERLTTLMYRPPEMIDIYSRRVVGVKADVWMLGCVLYTLAFFKHPFQDQPQLAIVNGFFAIPRESRFDEKFHNFIKWILCPDPEQRPGIGKILDMLERYDTITDFPRVYSNPVAQQAPRAKSQQDRDMTEEEMQREILRIRTSQQKQSTSTQLLDFSAKSIWSAPGEEPPVEDLQQKSESWAQPPPSSQSSQDWARF
jgi:AP2-associated kinase